MQTRRIYKLIKLLNSSNRLQLEAYNWHYEIDSDDINFWSMHEIASLLASYLDCDDPDGYTRLGNEFDAYLADELIILQQNVSKYSLVIDSINKYRDDLQFLVKKS